MCGFAYVVLIIPLLVGEVLLTEATSLCSMISKDRMDGNHKDAHVMVPLMGCFKWETGERIVLLLMTLVTKMGIAIWQWMEQLVYILVKQGLSVGKPGLALCDKDGFMLSSTYLNNEMHDMLENIQIESSDLLPVDVKIHEIYEIYRTYRRGVTIQAHELNYLQNIIDFNNQ